jgi:hypothetical protein
LFGRYKNLFAASLRSVALRLTAFLDQHPSAKKTALSKMKIIKSRYRSCLTGEHLKY